MNPESLENRIIDLEMTLAHQERLIDELSEEILKLNTRYERLLARFEDHEAQQDTPTIRSLLDEPPPPHY